MDANLEEGTVVRHAQYGQGTVRADLGATAVVRFEHGVEECQKRDLEALPSLFERLRRSDWDVPLEVVNRVQVEAIVSVNELRSRIEHYEELLNGDADDAIAAAEEELAEISSALVLMEDEEPTLRHLLTIADRIREETKIARLLEILEERFADRSVLFFTEYKATQSLLMSALLARYGADCVTFINGDDRADEVRMPNGETRSIRKPRDVAADEFNAGKVRFLVSTEAAGEGVDLQESCHTLIHVDLPWNPMRLHQRVGRLNRYGQQQRVEVLSIRNPDTVESRIWSKLDEKLERINETFAHVMDTPEDLRHLVLGMTSPQFFQRLFADAVETPREHLSDWFDQRAASFGGQDAVEVVEALVGRVHRFDFKHVSPRIPRVDLPDLQVFFEAALALNGRRATAGENGFAFNTPEAWRESPAVRKKYVDMLFDRTDRSTKSAQRLLGIGHKAVDQAVAQARKRDAAVATLPSSLLSKPLVVFRVQDRVTAGTIKPTALFGVTGPTNDGEPILLPDWKVLKFLNELPWRKEIMRDASPACDSAAAESAVIKAEQVLLRQLDQLVPAFRVPECQALAVLWPA